jgi:hypothetical protein
MRPALLATSLLSILVACDECPQLDCDAGFGIGLQSKDWARGDYTVHIEYADVELWCGFTVPEQSASPDDDAGTEASQPDGGSRREPRCLQTSGEPVEASVQIGQNVVLQIADEPQSLHIRVTRDQTTLKDVRVQPEYGKKRMDNGCPACPFALVSVRL